MSKIDGDSSQGTLDLLVLKTLARGPNHGFGVSLLVEEASGGLIRLEEGSLYPALHRLERDGWLEGEWQQTSNGRRARVYRITKAGAARLAKAENNWKHYSKGVNRVLRFV